MPQLNFNALVPEGPQGVYQGFMQGQQLRNKMLVEEQQRQLSDIQLQNAMREQRLAGEEEAAWKTGAGDPQKVLAELEARGLGKQALTLRKSLDERRAAQLAQQKTIVELSRDTAKRAMANPENAAQIYTNFGRQLGVDVSDDLAEIQKFGGNAEAIRQWAAGHALEADKLLPKFETRDLGGVVQRQGYSPVTGVAVGAPTTYQKTMAPGEAERINLDRERVKLEQRRVNLAEEEAKLKREGIEGIAPKELQKREAAFPAATQSLKGFETKSDSFIKDLEALRDHPGLSQITGIAAGRLPGLTAEGRAAQALYDKIVAKGGFQALQDLRDASKTGGALGNVSNQEGKQLTASFAAIDRRQDAPDVRAAIDQAIGDIQGSKTRMREAYDATYAYRSAKQAPAKPSNVNIDVERANAKAAIDAGAPAAAVRARFKQNTGQEL